MGAAASAALPEIDWRVLYLALVAGGMALAGGGWLLRLIGERLRWM
jgi:hypothetical protein